MICLGNIYDALTFRTTVYNTVHTIKDSLPPPPPDGHSNEDAVEDSVLCDVCGSSFNDYRGMLIRPFQCLDLGKPQSLAHHFHMGSIGVYA